MRIKGLVFFFFLFFFFFFINSSLLYLYGQSSVDIDIFFQDILDLRGPSWRSGFLFWKSGSCIYKN